MVAPKAVRRRAAWRMLIRGSKKRDADPRKSIREAPNRLSMEDQIAAVGQVGVPAVVFRTGMICMVSNRPAITMVIPSRVTKELKRRRLKKKVRVPRRRISPNVLISIRVIDELFVQLAKWAPEIPWLDAPKLSPIEDSSNGARETARMRE